MLSIKERKLVLKWDQKGKTQQEIAELLDCHQSSISRLINKHKRHKTIKNLPRSGRPTKLTENNLNLLKDKIFSRIKRANKKYCSISTKQVRKIIQREIGETYSLRHIERIMHKLGFSLITPRPEHIRHDQKKVDAFRTEFKKNLQKSMWSMS